MGFERGAEFEIGRALKRFGYQCKEDKNGETTLHRNCAGGGPG